MPDIFPTFSNLFIFSFIIIGDNIPIYIDGKKNNNKVAIIAPIFISFIKLVINSIKYLCNKASIIQVLNRWPFSMDDLRNVVNKLTFKDFHNIYIFGDDNLKQTVFDTLSNKRYEELLNDFKGIPEPSPEDFKKTLMHIDDLLDFSFQ